MGHPRHGIGVRLRAVSWAMSSSWGGCSLTGVIAVRASRNMVLQKGQAVAMVSAPVAASSRARTWEMRVC